MNDKVTAFNFSDVYRTLLPAAARDVVAAREAAHVEIYKQIKFTKQILDLCRLAFGLNISAQSELGSLLVTEVRKSDVQFSLTHDRAEASRIAALILSNRLAEGCTQDAIAVLAACFSGLRASADGDQLANQATACLAQKARARRVSLPNPTATYPKLQDRSALVTTMEQGISPQSLKPLFDAIIADDRVGGDTLAKNVSAIMQSLLTENQRLAEEVDLLWWHIGDWSECLHRPLGQVPEAGRGLIASVDLAAVIRVLPGPYGAMGVLRRSLGLEPDREMNLRESVEALTPEDLKEAYQQCTNTDILPVHTAVQLYLDRGRGQWEQHFEKACGVSCDAPLSPYKIALQAFWESCLIKHGWAK